jgi:DNA-binding MarR family transcriptional regulator
VSGRSIAKVISIRYQSGMIETARTPDRIADLLLHLGRAARREGGLSDLTAAQWTCLRFFARANGSTRTPSGFASFQATTRGTASQIVRSLERRGLVARNRSTRDGRSVRFDLTEAGRAMLGQDPLRELIGEIDALGSAERDRFLGTLSRLASALSVRRAAPAFGTCRDCCHFTAAGPAGHCACMAAELAADEIDRLCASYRGPVPATEEEGERHGAD